MIAILMSTYNGARYLAEQLDSILAQTYADWKLTVRDDGSTDDTLRVLQQYAKADKRISVLTDGENIGACRSFERLLTQCVDAEYYAFCDQDDVWRSDKLALSLDAIQQAEKVHPGKPIVVHTDLQVVDENRTEIAPSFWRYSNIQADFMDAHIRYLAICNSVTGCAMLFNKAARDCSLPMSANAYMHDAWLALMTAYHGGYVLPVHQTPVAYRQHGDNVLGAIHYSTFGRSIESRKFEAHVSYARSKGYVYRNKAQFLLWKTIYFLHRSLWVLVR